MRWFRLRVVFLLALLGVVAGAPAAVQTAARLILPVESVRPGESFLVGVELSMNPGWHTYWRNGGDSGAPTTLEWKLPPGITAGAIRWPAPELYAEADLVTFVYHGKVTLLVPFTVDTTAQEGAHEIVANLRWLECKENCVPGRGSASARLTIGSDSKPSPQAAVVAEAAARLPKALPQGSADASWGGPPEGDERLLLLRWRPGTAGASGEPEFIPDSSETFEVRTATERTASPEGEYTLRKRVRKIEGDWPREVRGVLALLDARLRPVLAFEAALPIGEGGDPPPPAAATRSATPAPVTPAASPAPTAVSVPSLSLASALLFGLIGGIILNIMPCVLPVIALKILGFVRQSGSRPAEVRKLGLVYALGVWFSFLVLAGVVIGVKRAVGIASWGMQFGNPIFLVAMCTLVLLVALSLFGVFEIAVGGRALDAAGDLASKEGSAGAFFNGMLAVALATPCTAPFLAPALGYALAAEPFTIVLVFSAVALGLAAPYVILSWHPAWLKMLPKPGAWMERFKVAMGFPMLATALWLYTLAAQRLGPSGPVWFGLFLVCLALAAWVWGEFVQRSLERQTAGRIAALIIAVAAYAYALEKELDWRHPAPAAARTTGARSSANRPHGIVWEPWSKSAVDAARAAGKPVFVDFTADWCLSCQLNEKSSIEIPAVREKLAAIGAVTLKADYTDIPRDITEELQRFGRSAVPMVLVYPRDASKPPVVMPVMLTPSMVLEALDQAAR